MSNLTIIRRIAETGLKYSLDEHKNHEFTDLFQHILDELERVETVDAWALPDDYNRLDIGMDDQ